MTLVFEEVPGAPPLARRVWSARCEATSSIVSTAKASTTLSFARYQGAATAYVHGPETRATSLVCPEGWEFFGVELRPGAYLPHHLAQSLVDREDARLSTPSGRIELDGREWEMPTEQNVDVFVERLVRAGLLVFDPLVDEIGHGERPRSTSERTAQLRFRRAVGISRRAAASIDRARSTARFLAAGGSIADAIVVGGYYDQSQLTHAVRRATGHTPGRIGSAASSLVF